MTKTIKCITIDIENARRLESIQNASSFINDMLTKHFDKNKSVKDLELELKQIELKEEYEKKLKEIK